MPGCTTIASYGDNKSGLIAGMAKATARIAVFDERDIASPESYARWLSGEAQRRWDAKADLGTRVHAHALARSQNRPIDLKADELGHVFALDAFIEKEVDSFTTCETVVGDGVWGYGGRGDAWGVLKSYGPSLWDYKTGERRYSELKDALQLAGLASAKGFVRYDASGMVVDGFGDMPEIGHWLDVYLADDGNYKIYETPIDELLIQSFRQRCLAYHADRRARGALKGKPNGDEQDGGTGDQAP